jgi:excisionase family DNA binding protein
MCGISPRDDLHMACHPLKKARGEVMAIVKREHQSRIGRTRSEVHQPLLLTIPEAAASLRLSRAKVYRLIYYEGLPVVHFGRAARVSVIALQEWLEERNKSA